MQAEASSLEDSPPSERNGELKHAAHLILALYLTALVFAVQAKSTRASPTTGSIQRVICGVFGPYCSQALRVAYCESRLELGAANGQYLGLFQMGSNARSRYGHGSDPWTQAEAAFRYFADSGFSWGPWSCKP